METGADTEFSYIEKNKPNSAPTCQICGRNIGMLEWTPPYVVELETWERRFGDLAFGVSDEILVSDHFRKNWINWRLTGLTEFEPVTIDRVKRHQKLVEMPPKYFCVRITRSGARINLKASEFEPYVEAECEKCLMLKEINAWKRIVFEEGTWTRESIFFAWGMPGAIFVDDKFRMFAKECRISNCQLIPIDEYSHEF